MSDIFYISKSGLKKLKTELEEMKFVKRPQISEKIATARDFGDLKENAEYHAAREELSLLEAKISKMEDTIARARVVNPADISTEQCALYTQVRMKDLKRKREVSYSLVSEEEADFQKLKISVTSPVGKALIGSKVGEKVDIKVPAGVLKYEILEISAYQE